MKRTMPKKPKIIEPIPATMDQVVKSFFTKDPKPKKSSQENKKIQFSPTKVG